MQDCQSSEGGWGCLYIAWKDCTSAVYTGAQHVGLSLTKHQYSLNKAFSSSKQALKDHWSSRHRLEQLAELSDGLALPWLSRTEETSPQRSEKDMICTVTQTHLNTNSSVSPSATQTKQTRLFLLLTLFTAQKSRTKEPCPNGRRVQGMHRAVLCSRQHQELTMNLQT